jgi:hypothetical protein
MEHVVLLMSSMEAIRYPNIMLHLNCNLEMKDHRRHSKIVGDMVKVTMIIKTIMQEQNAASMVMVKTSPLEQTMNQR